ncbi:ADP-ribosylation factor GTPase-activating protein AGD3 [Camellia lanceoleosa]|uniref:ADP-ribosylation factor GTPase-activating protein AGD3 n=1 Tax=Camellia lanceoleosa TaxID=1840588 RepID=A0ACC0GNR9_9ERIC|nr:ADP-ribosylation factor GTPase-activating protein AGD3 [Camellia lanceoleosa]
MRSHMRKIDKDVLSAIIFLMVSLFVISTSVRAEPNFISCDVSPANYTQNSPFGNNLKRLLESLWSNTPLSQGFNSTAFGNSTDQVYGRALCRGDVTPEVCQDCVHNASLEIMTVCPTQNAIIWHEFCQVQYSYQPFRPWDGYIGMYPDSNKDEKNISDSVDFVVVLKDFMNKLSDQAAFNPSNLMFATGKTKISMNEMIYGLVQCTRDISQSDCRVCLNSEFGDLDGCCDYRQGGTVLSRNCNMRFQLYPFYNEPTVNGETFSDVIGSPYYVTPEELNNYLTVSTSTSVIVDKSSDGDFLLIDFNVSFPTLSCEFASVDVSDVLGTAREKFLSLRKGTKNDIATILEEELHNARSAYEQDRFNLVTALSNVEAKKRFEFLEVVSDTMDAHLRYFKQGYELLNQMEPYINQVLTYAQQSRERSYYEQAALNERMQEYKRQIDRESRRSSNGSNGSPNGDGIQAIGRSSHKMIEANMQCCKGKGSNYSTRLSFKTFLKLESQLSGLDIIGLPEWSVISAAIMIADLIAAGVDVG